MLLDRVEDPKRRLEVLKARVERLKVVLQKLSRKRYTSARTVLGVHSTPKLATSKIPAY